ncbi:hypothetical protein GCM10017786_36250 [Amycolatopsis deserti]|uniref:Uncharacterized protein n=1 Tax=Amycolatopsis deserti TaxID=185696 RepID=A0ABQ3J3L7_9PSEU|nr:hypothetical protein GCM10017786_36250 [Amycolatopsis deserti]
MRRGEVATANQRGPSRPEPPSATEIPSRTTARLDPDELSTLDALLRVVEVAVTDGWGTLT